MGDLSPHAILFDLDGVLLDSRAPFARSINGSLAEHGFGERPEDVLHRFLGPPVHETFETLLGPDADADLVQSCVDEYRRRYREVAAELTPIFDGACEMLDDLGADHPLAVATTKPKPVTVELLEALGLRARFAVVEAPSLEATHEPKHVTVARVLEQLPGSVFLGDRSTDMEAARMHGLRGIGALWGIGTEEELRAAGADAVAARPADVAPLARSTS